MECLITDFERAEHRKKMDEWAEKYPLADVLWNGNLTFEEEVSFAENYIKSLSTS